MESTQANVTIQEGGQIVIPDSVLKELGLQVGDTLNLTYIQEVIVARKEGNSTNALSLLEELGNALHASGYNTKAKVHSLIDSAKMEVTSEWENRIHKP